jgi:hypothetical protein
MSNILKVLKREARKIAAKVDHLTGELGKVKAAISVLNGSGRRGPRKGRKLTAAHRRAIKEGIRRAKAGRK